MSGIFTPPSGQPVSVFAHSHSEEVPMYTQNLLCLCVLFLLERKASQHLFYASLTHLMLIWDLFHFKGAQTHVFWLSRIMSQVLENKGFLESYSTCLSIQVIVIISITIQGSFRQTTSGRKHNSEALWWRHSLGKDSDRFCKDCLCNFECLFLLYAL